MQYYVFHRDIAAGAYSYVPLPSVQTVWADKVIKSCKGKGGGIKGRLCKMDMSLQRGSVAWTLLDVFPSRYLLRIPLTMSPYQLSNI